LFAMALELLRQYMNGAGGTDAITILQLADAGNVVVRAEELATHGTPVIRELVVYLLSISGSSTIGNSNTISKIIAECVLPLPRFRAEQVRRLGDALAQLLHGSMVPSPQSQNRRGSPVVGISGANASQGAWAKSSAVDDSASDEEPSRKSAHGPRGAQSSSVHKNQAGGTATAFGASKPSQRQTQQDHDPRPSPLGASSSASTAGLSAYAMRKKPGNLLAASGASSSASANVTAAPKKALVPSGLLSRIRNDPNFATAALADNSDDEIADLDY